MKLTKKLKEEILQAYHGYWKAYLKGDIRAMSSWMHEEIQVIGSSRGEVFKNKKETIRYYKATSHQVAGKADMRNRRITVTPAGDQILVTEESDFFVRVDGAWTFYGEGRISTQFIKTDQGWMIIHEHGSLPDARTSGGQQLNTKKIKEENIRLKEAVRRRTKELEEKNRELEIESSLERVRTVAMGMKKREDMLQICKTISLQLKSLGLKEIRNVQTAIFYESRGTYMNYEYYAKHKKTFITETVYTDHKIAKAFAAKMLKGKGEVSITHIKGKQKLKEWIAYQKGTNVFLDTYLYKASSLHYYWYSLGPVALGISTYQLLTKDEMTLFQRFLDVFELSYRRYLDIEKALGQAREAQIEVSLEKIRARTMAMQRSDELPETSHLLFQQFRALGLIPDQVSIGVFKEEEGIAELSATVQGKQLLQMHRVPINESFVMKSVVAAWKAKKESAFVELKGKKLNEYNRWRNDFLGSKVFKPVGSKDRWIVTAAFFSKGLISFSSHEPCSGETLQLLKRFAGVFDQTYTRFLDLQKAEAQAREAEIELALERVRARTMAMQSQAEFLEVINVIGEQFVYLGFDIEWVNFGAKGLDITEGIDTWNFAVIPGGSPVSDRLFIPYFDHPLFSDAAAWLDNYYRTGHDFFIMSYGKEDKDRWLDHLFTKTVFSNVPDEYRAIQYAKPGYTTSNLALKDTFLSIGKFDNRVFTDEQHIILRRFGNAFGQAYTRFLDLQKAEAQAVHAEQDLAAIKEAKQKAEETLSALQATQKQLIQSEKMASLGELTAGIAHEIQNPLNFVNNFSEVSKELLDEMKTELDEGNTEEAMQIAGDVILNLEKINHHGKRADAIVKGMLQHSRSSSGQKEMTDINVLADEYLRLAYHGLRAKDKSFNAKFETQFDNSVSKINIVPQEIGRVILNLINNAFYAVTEKRKSGVENYEPAVTVSTRKRNNKVEITVADNGKGIPQTVLDKIFQPFFTTKPSGQGTGLGLSLSYDIITKGHNGELKVETKEDQGTSFIIVLPA